MPYICRPMQQLITSGVLERSISWDAYLQLMKDVVASPNPPGVYADEKMHRYTQSNLERTNLVLDKMVLNQKLYNALSELKGDWVWLVLSEPWCGDASWGTTALYILSTATEHIDFRILLRDTNLDIMQGYQTNGGNAIPKLVCLRKSDLAELGTWGPRPQVVQALVNEMKADASIGFKENVRRLHAWYEADMTNSIQDEILDLVREWRDK